MEYKIHCGGNGVHHSIKFTYFIARCIFGKERNKGREREIKRKRQNKGRKLNIESESENIVLKNLGSKHLSFLFFYLQYN